MDIIGPLQLRVMHHIWRQGPSTVHQVHEALNEEPDASKLAYTTILTVMRNLAKRDVLEQRPNGRAHLFTPLVTEREYKQSVIKQVLDEVFENNPKSFFEYLSTNNSFPPRFRKRASA